MKEVYFRILFGIEIFLIGLSVGILQNLTKEKKRKAIKGIKFALIIIGILIVFGKWRKLY